MINYTISKKSKIAKEVSKIISSICTLKFEYDCELTTQQKKDLDGSLMLLKKVLAKAVE